MGTKKEIKEQITSVLEENFNFILNTQDSLLNLQNTLSTNELKISMYHIKTFMNNKGYTYDKTTNEWSPINITENNPSNNEVTEGNENTLEANEHEIVEYKEILSESITDDLKEFLKENSNKINKNTVIQLSSNIEKKTKENIQKVIAENIKEKSLIPEANILKELLKITDNTYSNCELILKSIIALSNQLTKSSVLSINEDSKINTINEKLSVDISPSQFLEILDGETKRYELTLPIAFFEAITKKYYLKHSDKTPIKQLKESKIIYKILIDYFTS